MPNSARHLLLAAYAEALTAVAPERCVRAALEGASPPGPWLMLAVGKAAAGMARGALAAAAEAPRGGLVVVPHGTPAQDLVARGLRVFHAGHPLPDAGSFAAGQAAFEWVGAQPVDLPLRVLLSGGASALLEHPQTGDAAGLVARHRELQRLGLDIATLNRERAALSALKRGGLARAARARPVSVWVMSDVPGDDLRLVGSGPFDRPEVPHHLVASNATARAAVMRWAEARGVAAHDHGAVLEGDAARAGRQLMAELATAAPGLHVWGGETTVRLPPGAGRGGRCQHLALAAALAAQPGVVLLAAGTDGRDGAGGAAGALVDGGTVARARAEGRDPQADLEACMSGDCLAASGDLIDTGPTGTNVMDLVFALKPVADG